MFHRSRVHPILPSYMCNYSQKEIVNNYILIIFLSFETMRRKNSSQLTWQEYFTYSQNLPCLIHFNGLKGSKERTISRDFKRFTGVEWSWLLGDRDINMIIVFPWESANTKIKREEPATAVFYQITRHSHYLRDWNRLSRMVKILLN